MLGKHHSDETKQKMRISTIKYIENSKGPLRTRIGRQETQLLDLQEQKDSCNIQRQYQIKTLGYIVDGYCHETNTIYEVYEPWHNKKIQKDLQRQNEICNELSCNFVILRGE